MPKILVVGDLNPDIVLEGVPEQGGRLRFGQAEDVVTKTSITLGGSAAITASAALHAGASVALVAVVGLDELGGFSLKRAADQGLNIRSVRVGADVRTGSSVILVSGRDRDDRHILTDLGSMRALLVDDLPDALLTQYDHVHISSFFMHEGARDRLHERMRRSRDLGATVSLDTNDDPSLEWESGAGQAVREADLVFANDVELVGLAGVGAVEPVHAAQLLLERMPSAGPWPGRAQLPAVIQKKGSLGATVHTRNGQVSVLAPSVDVVDAIGAGDTLGGTVIALVRDGADWPRALSVGVAAASMSTGAAGGVDAQPDLIASASVAATLSVEDSRGELVEEQRG